MKATDILSERETKRASMELEIVKLDGSFSGYASLFGEVDQGRDLVAPGAFKSSLKGRSASSVRMLFQHDPDQPIGVWKKIIEDSKGLYVEGQITPNVKRSEEILELMRAGAIDGLSIGFKTKQAKVNPETKIRSIIVADLWEISVVTFPLLEGARIESVKSSRVQSLPTKREFERWLMRDAGLSRRDAKRMISAGYDAIQCKRDAAIETPLAHKIRKATQTLSSRI